MLELALRSWSLFWDHRLQLMAEAAARREQERQAAAAAAAAQKAAQDEARKAAEAAAYAKAQQSRGMHLWQQAATNSRVESEAVKRASLHWERRKPRRHRMELQLGWLNMREWGQRQAAAAARRPKPETLRLQLPHLIPEALPDMQPYSGRSDRHATPGLSTPGSERRDSPASVITSPHSERSDKHRHHVCHPNICLIINGDDAQVPLVWGTLEHRRARRLVR